MDEENTEEESTQWRKRRKLVVLNKKLTQVSTGEKNAKSVRRRQIFSGRRKFFLVIWTCVFMYYNVNAELNITNNDHEQTSYEGPAEQYKPFTSNQPKQPLPLLSEDTLIESESGLSLDLCSFYLLIA